MIFNKTTSYAFEILHCMAEDDKKVFSAAYLHERLGIPKQYLRALLTRLSEKSLIKSIRGRNGGFSIARASEKIFLSEIVDALHGKEVLHDCIMGFEKCPFDHHCVMHNLWERTRNEIEEVLKKTTLAVFKKSGQL